jgi:RNA polymerase sigma factor (sigma-70 family)
MASGPVSPVIRFIRKIADTPSNLETTDGQLLTRFVVQRDPAAFAALVERHGRLVLSVCRRVLRHAHDAEDAFQATFLVLVRRAGSIDKHESVGSWLHGVAYRVAAKARDSLYRERARARPLEDLPAAEPVQEAVWRDLRRVLDEEVQRLPEKYRMPLVLCYLEGKTTDEAAVDLGCPRGTVGTRVARARHLLRSRLAQRGVTLSAGLLTLGWSEKGAAVSPALVESTTRAAASFAAGQSAAAGAISPYVAALTKGVLRTMFLTKLKLAAVLMLAVGVAGTGAGVLSFQALAGGQSAEKKAERPNPAGKQADDDKKDDDRAADRLQSQENLRQIGLAMFYYHDQFGRFPAAAIYDGNGKALLSWRVALLPFLKQDILYREFHLDEPWDSAHNRKLMAQMPAIFAPPGIKTKTPHATYYRVFTGTGTVFDGQQGLRIRDITDGLANTILVIEAGEPVSWTKPDELPYDADKPLPKLGGIFKDGFHFVAADDACHFATKGVNEKKLRLAITRNDGKRFDLSNDLEP